VVEKLVGEITLGGGDEEKDTGGNRTGKEKKQTPIFNFSWFRGGEVKRPVDAHQI